MMSVMETRDAGQERRTSRVGPCDGRLCGRAGSSQQVDDVGKEDEAYDGEKHQHQNVHHDGNTARDGRCGSEKDAQQNSSAVQKDRPRSEAFGGSRREMNQLDPPPWRSETGSEDPEA